MFAVERLCVPASVAKLRVIPPLFGARAEFPEDVRPRSRGKVTVRS
jgi:hypothetical protein